VITVLIDSHFLGYRAYYTTGHLSHEDKATGIPYGFLWSILLIAEKFKTNKFIFFWDSGSWRKKVFPEYKASRREGTEEEQKERERIHQQFDYLKESILLRLGFSCWQVPEMESDDLIAGTIVNHPDKRFVIVSSDNDLYQLLTKSNVAGMYDPAKHKLYRAFDFYQEYGIAARDWTIIKCIAGCSSDGVPGVPGVGTKTAIKYITEKLNPKSKAYRNIVENPAIVKRNYRLVALPMYTTPIIPLPKSSEMIFTEVQAEDLFRRLGFESFLKEDIFERWMNFSRGAF